MSHISSPNEYKVDKSLSHNDALKDVTCASVVYCIYEGIIYKRALLCSNIPFQFFNILAGFFSGL